MRKCDVILRFSITERLKVGTKWLDWDQAVKKAIEKIKNKYKWKDVCILNTNWEYF